MRRLVAPILLLALLLLILSQHRPDGPEPTRPERTEGTGSPAEVALPTYGSPVSPEARSPGSASRTVRVKTNVPGAEVRLRFVLCGPDAPPPPLRCAADALGAAEFVFPPPASRIELLIAEARADGRIPASRTVLGDEVELDLRPGVRLRGRVVDGDGTPVAGAKLALAGGTRDESNGDGRFEVWATASRPWTLTVSHPARVGFSTEVTPPADDFLVTLDRGRTVRGRVVLSDGRPVADVPVWSGRQRTTTGPGGRFKLSGLTAGHGSVACSAVRWARPIPADASDVEFVCEAHVVRFRVVDTEGRRIPRVSLRFALRPRPPQAMTHLGGRTDDRGELLTCQGPGGVLLATVGVGGYRPVFVEVDLSRRPDAHDVKVVLPEIGAHATVAVAARDERGGSFPGLDLFLLDPAGEAFLIRHVRLDATGRGVAPDLPPGEYGLRLAPPRASPTYALPWEGSVKLEEGWETRVSARLPLGGRIRVVVRNADGSIGSAEGLSLRATEGQPCSITLRHEDADHYGYLIPGARVTSQPVPVGEYVLLVERGGERRAEQRVRVVAGESTEVELRLVE